VNLVYPNFTLADYRSLIGDLLPRWQIVRVCDAAFDGFRPNTLILRHDIDFSPALALPMAELEHSRGIRSTYFAALHLHYNANLPAHANALKSISEMGHEIGLHYDSRLYEGKASLEETLALLDTHVQILQEICGYRVRSLVRHNPSISKDTDPLEKTGQYVNAYDEKFFQNTVYISDSCRAWRDGGLKACWYDPRPERIYLLVHPELWGETIEMDRMVFLEILRSRVMGEYESFFDEARLIWRNHHGGKEHDARLGWQKQRA
jgi:uncharacterized protein YuzE